MAKNRKHIRVIPLGGMGEIGKNMTVIEYEKDFIIIDTGLMFPDDEMLGIDLVIPDMTYVVENQDRLRGIFLTHGHEDHIGALPYLLRQVQAPVFGTKLTLGLLKGKLEEIPPGHEVDLRQVQAGSKVQVGPFRVEFMRVSHSIADAVALAVETPLGNIIHTGDFKFDQTPIDGQPTDFHRFAEYGQKGVLLLISDSTNAERPGYTMSERKVGETFENTFAAAPQRIIVASFASNVHRIQQIADAAKKYNRKICVVGRSMVNVVGIARELGYLDIPDGMLVDLNEVDKIPHERLVIITTGSQGEPMSALTRMAMAEHKKLTIVPGDTVIISANPIPGNEKLVGRTINSLFEQGAQVIYEAVSGVHVSGHASQEELKMMLNLVKPKYFMPAHGEYRHLVKHTHLAKMVGIPDENIFVLENGDVLEISFHGARIVSKVTAGQVLVDGLGVGDVGNIVLRDRKLLSQDGILIVVLTLNKQTGDVVAGPDIVSRGFVYVREAEDLMEQAKVKVKAALEASQTERATEWATIKTNVKDALSQFLYEKTKRRPMILPIIMEV